MEKNFEKSDGLFLTHLKHIKETTDRTERELLALKDDNVRQWQRLEKHEVRLAKIETKMNGGSFSKFNYDNLKYIILAALAFIGGIIAIIMKYQN